MANAWDAYVNNLKSGGCQIAGIYGQDGSSWAANCSISNQEISRIVKIINAGKKDNDDNPITLEGKGYTLVRVSAKEYATMKRKNDETDDAKRYLVTLQLSKTAVVIGGACGSAERGASVVVGSITDYLTTNNI